MSNATKEKSLVELFESSSYSVVRYLECLLNEDNVPVYLQSDFGMYQLSDYKKLFDWDTVYVVRSTHTVYCDSIEVNTKCTSKEEAEEYLKGDKSAKPTQEDWDDYYPAYEVDGIDRSPVLLYEVENLRLKAPKKKSWKITFTNPDYLEKSVNLAASNLELLEATRCKEFYALIEGSQVEGALVAYGEAVQDGACD